MPELYVPAPLPAEQEVAKEIDKKILYMITGGTLALVLILLVCAFI
jgi:hypothetical protein